MNKTQRFTFYSNAIAHVCAGQDLPHSSIVTKGDAHKRASVTMLHGFDSHAEQAGYCIDMGEHITAGGGLLIVEVSTLVEVAGQSPIVLGYVVVWFDPEGDSIQYDALRIHYADTYQAPDKAHPDLG